MNPLNCHSRASHKSKLKSTTDAKSITRTLNSYFSSVFNDTSAGCNVASYDIVNYDNVASPKNTMENFGIISEEILTTLNDMKTNKRPGSDNICPKVLKENKNEIANILVSIFNKSLQQGIVLANRKTANVTSFFFKKGDRK